MRLGQTCPRLARVPKRCCSTGRSPLAPLPALPNGELKTFQEHAFGPAKPALLPMGYFNSLPAVAKWFVHNDSQPKLAVEYFAPHAELRVVTEVTTQNAAGRTESFARSEAPLGAFVAHVVAVKHSYVPSAGTRVYIAQHDIASLPPSLQADLPTPELVRRAGRGDVYASSIWLGLAPTFTPLHRDPNPNVFAQLAGRKVVRVYEPAVGADALAQAEASVKRHGRGSSAMIDEEAMAGPLREAIEDIVWGKESKVPGFEAEVGPGDGVFIPKGWWHSFKGIGEGMVGSANWWFR